MELLSEHQLNAVAQMHNGCILAAEVGVGKSRTALAYYVRRVCGGKIGSVQAFRRPKDLYIITTAKKRDNKEWLLECGPFCLTSNPKVNPSGVSVTVDSWNNISKYKNVYGAFFIFDEQRVKGHGAWVKAFLRIAVRNQWILLSATPGDKWEDYVPVFVANGYFKNRTAFEREHCIFQPYVQYKNIIGYKNTGILYKYRDDILVKMEYKKKAEKHHVVEICSYDATSYRRVWKDRIDIFDGEPIETAGKLCYVLRKVVNSDESRMAAVRKILAERKKAIVFYNFDYELESLRTLTRQGVRINEWNGHRHEATPDELGDVREDHWAYLVQYSSGCEGWNCVSCDTMIFFSQTYSYAQQTQAEGRIDRMNTPFTDLYYYHLKSDSPIDTAIARSFKQKKDFNAKTFTKNRFAS